jgi:hypothetical protein
MPITNWKERSKTELTGRSPLRKRRSTLDCNAIEKEEEEEEAVILHSLMLCR